MPARDPVGAGEQCLEFRPATGGITPVGLPEEWPILVDAAVVAQPLVVVGSGLRRSKLVLPGTALAELPGAEVVDGLARPA